MDDIVKIHECNPGVLRFWCPGCKQYHYIGYKPGNAFGFPVWNWNGDRCKPTINPSVKVVLPLADRTEVCHSFIRGGKIEYLLDCTHGLRGKTVDMVEL